MQQEQRKEKDFYVFLFLRNTSKVVILADINRLISSATPRRKTAVDPISDHNSGIIRIEKGVFLWFCNSSPKVNIVVGHGNPKVGEEG